jgi:uncharacterized membrane protein
MKKFLFIFLIGTITLFAQTVNESIERDFNAYSKLIVDKKIDKAMEYINPKLFNIATKEQMVAMLESIYNVPEIDIKLFMPTIDSYGNLQTVEGINYVKIQVTTPIEMKFNNPEFKNEMIPLYLASFEEEFGKGNVVFDEKVKAFKITSSNPVIASSTDQNKNWKFITIDNKEVSVLLETIVPLEILE